IPDVHVGSVIVVYVIVRAAKPEASPLVTKFAQFAVRALPCSGVGAAPIGPQHEIIGNDIARPGTVFGADSATLAVVHVIAVDQSERTVVDGYPPPWAAIDDVIDHPVLVAAGSW